MIITLPGKGSSHFDGLIEQGSEVEEFHYNTPTDCSYDPESTTDISYNLAIMDGMALDFKTEFANAQFAIGRTVYNLGLLGTFCVNHIFIEMPAGSSGFTGPDDDAAIDVGAKTLGVKCWNDGTIEVYDGGTMIIKNQTRNGSAVRVLDMFVEYPVIYLYSKVSGYDNTTEDYINRLDFTKSSNNRFSSGYMYRPVEWVSNLSESIILYPSVADRTSPSYKLTQVMGTTTTMLLRGITSWYFNSGSPVMPSYIAQQLAQYDLSSSSGGQMFYIHPLSNNDVIDSLRTDIEDINDNIESLDEQIKGIASLNYTVR